MTKAQKSKLKKQINEMIWALDYARSIDEAWDIEQGIIELEQMLYAKKCTY